MLSQRPVSPWPMVEGRKGRTLHYVRDISSPLRRTVSTYY